MKSSKWMLFFGILLLILSVLMFIGFFTNPSKILVIKISAVFSAISWFAFGLVLILVYLNRKHKEETSGTLPENIPDSSEDKEILVKKQNAIFAYFIFISIILTSYLWILNDYTQGLTLINIQTIFDLVLNLILAYLVTMLILGKGDRTKLLYAVIFYSLGGSVIELLRGQWYFAVAQSLPIIFFYYAIKGEPSRKRHRISNFIILPSVILAIIVLGYIQNYNLTKIQKEESKAEQAYFNANTDLGTAYSYLLQQDKPTKEDAQSVQDKALVGKKKMTELVDKIHMVQEEYKKELSSVQKITSLQVFQNSLELLDIFNKQNDEIIGFMEYLKKIDTQNITEAQRVEIGRYVRAVEDYNRQSRELSLEFPDRF